MKEEAQREGERVVSLIQEGMDQLKFKKTTYLKHGKFKCGCPVGTPIRWRDAKGRITHAGRMSAITTECVNCGDKSKA